MSLLPWLEPLAKRARDAVAEARLPHALLVTGPEGWGEGAFASWLALFLLGLDQDRDVVGLAHPDLRWKIGRAHV